MSFELSKYLWSVVEPTFLATVIVVLGTVLLWTGWRRVGKWLLTGAVLLMLAVTIFPLGSWLYWTLENRFPPPVSMPRQVDGIIVLGGSINQFMTKERDQVTLNRNASRLTEFIRLARAYPDARLVFSGGSGAIRQDLREADVARRLFSEIGFDADRVVYEANSRNTFENAVNARDLVKPKSSENWLLVTSAFHMPRAVGCFRNAGWKITPYPVEYRTGLKAPILGNLNIVRSLVKLSAALHEWLGLAAYYFMGRTDKLFPAPLVR